MEIVNGWWVTGIIDGEGCFEVSLERYHKARLGIGQPRVRFIFSLRADDAETIKKIVDYFKGETVQFVDHPGGFNKHPLLTFWVVTKGNLPKMLTHFDKFPLQSKKREDYEIWKKAAKMFLEKRRSSSSAVFFNEFEKLIKGIREVRRYKDKDLKTIFGSMFVSGKNNSSWRFLEKKRVCSVSGCGRTTREKGVCWKCRNAGIQRERRKEKEEMLFW